MSRITPPMGVKGVFLLREPFSISSQVVYEVGAIRMLSEMVRQGDDPLEMVYKAVGLSEVEYQADIKAGAQIVTLMADGRDQVYVPDTYIDSYPNMAVVAHSHVVAVVSLGMLPDTYDTAAVEESITQAVSDYTGVESTVMVAKAPTSDAITQDQYIQNLAARQAAVKNRSSNYADKLKLQELVDMQQDEINRLLLIIEELQANTD